MPGRAQPGLHPELLLLVRRLRRRSCRLALGGGAFAALSAFLMALLAAALVERFCFLGAGARWLFFYAVLGPPLLAFLLAGLLPLWRSRSAAGLLQLAEAAVPATRNLLRSASELAALESVATLDSLSFRAALQDRAGEAARRLSPAAVIPLRRLRRPLGLAAAACLLAVLAGAIPSLGFWPAAQRILRPGADLPRFSITQVEILPGDALVPEGEDLLITAVLQGRPAAEARLYWRNGSGRNGSGAGGAGAPPESGVLPMTPLSEPEGGAEPSGRFRRFEAALTKIQGPLRAFVRAGDGESKTISIRTAPRPAALRFAKRFRYPDYLERPVREVIESDGNLQALQGTRVRLAVEASQELEGAKLVLGFPDAPPREIPMQARGREAELEELAIERSGAYQVVLIAASTGFTNAWSPAYELRADPDRPPAVELLEPVAPLILPPDGFFSAAAKATDDYGLDALLEVITVNDGLPLIRTAESGGRRRELDYRGTIDLWPLKLLPGDRVQVAYRARDLQGKEADSAPLSIAISLPGKIPPAGRLLEVYLEAAGRLDRLAEEAKGLAARAGQGGESPDSLREEVRSWTGRAGTALKVLEQGLQLPLAAETEEDLALLHQALLSALCDAARPGEALLEEGGRSARTAGPLKIAFKKAADRTRQLAGAAGPLLVEAIAVHGFLRRLEVIAGRIEEHEERLPGAARKLLPNQMERLAKERRALSGELAAQLSILARLEEGRSKAGAAMRGTQAFAPFYNLLPLVRAAVEGAEKRGAWKELSGKLREFLRMAERPVEGIGAAAVQARQTLRPWALSQSQALEELVKGGSPLALAWRETARRVRAADGRRLYDFRAHFQTLNDVLEKSDAALVEGSGSLRLGFFKERSALCLAQAEAPPEADRRFAGDLALLERAAGKIGREQRGAMRSAFLRSCRIGDLRTFLAAADGLFDAKGRYEEGTVERLKRAADLFALLEKSHAAGALARRCGELAERAGSQRPPALSESGDLKRRFEGLLEQFEKIRREASERGAGELAAELERLQSASGLGAARQVFQDGARRKSAEEAFKVKTALEAARRGLEDLFAAETPQIRTAREELRRMAPSLAEETAAALAAAREARDRTADYHVSLSGAGIEKEVEKLERALEGELEAAEELKRLRGRLRREAGALDLSAAQGVKQAKELEAAALFLEEPRPAPEDLLAAAGPLPKEEKGPLLDRTMKGQARRVERLEKLLDKFGRGEAERPDLSRKLSSETGEAAHQQELEGELEKRYGPVEALAELRDRENRLADSTERAAAMEKQPGAAPEPPAEYEERLAELARRQEEVKGGLENLLEASSRGRKARGDLLSRQLRQAVEALERQEKEQKSLAGRLEKSAQEFAHLAGRIQKERARLRSEREQAARAGGERAATAGEAGKPSLEEVARWEEELADQEKKIGAGESSLYAGAARQEEDLARRAGEVGKVLERAEEHARQLADERARGIEAARRKLAGEALPAMKSSGAEIAKAGGQGLDPARPPPPLPLEAMRRAEAGLREARLSFQLQDPLASDEAGGPSAAGARPSAGGEASFAEAAGDMAEALDQMAGAQGSIRQGELEAAAQAQRGAARELAQAMRAAAQSLAAARDQRARAGEAGEGAAEGPGEHAESAAGSRALAGPAASARGSALEESAAYGRLPEGARSPEESWNSSDWAALPSHLKREILQSRREGIPPRFREQVEAYFRRVAEAARGEKRR
ncbi:MAG: hypothetical protein HY717_20730 [Planctomycetes bacterium]|nr:hypothetical protein [Planctomycetota bacterium]